MLTEQVNMTSSTDRLTWTSDSHTGMFDAHKHKNGRTFEEHFYGHTEGFASRRQATELREGGGL